MDIGKSNNKKKKFLGVRQRTSGRWVAEIKVSSQKLRLWLGTFNRPEEAAMAYDLAARILRGNNAKTNFASMGESNNYQVSLRNSRLHQLMQHEELSSCVHETLVCSDHGKKREEVSGVSSGGSRVYSSVVVVPSFEFEG
ncbi:uncharacterized protein A4U43_C05F22940 [Asparagus officinalis]|uniref:AP2/ERF domain-containing protein n=1 Tax=Asparagus officinalis TaxID=4686 RepID=A0A5P1EV54_ASPOF|nr:ethylene-responsive transcription factor RAP2-11-like [Asparagus officinalis]ONK69443.1 uncharacterized protein A4U43_C05F22940 [Asparagus officinalis]